MIVDSRELAPGSVRSVDLCIIGAGAAGIALAREFLGTGHTVALLESGGFERDAHRHDLFQGEFSGPFSKQKFLTGSRCRYFGGTTNRWTGTCRPLDPIDFEERPWVADSGWPIGLNDLEAFYRRAAALVDIPEFEEYGPNGQLFGFNLVGGVPEPRVVPKRLYLSNPPARFGPKYKEELETSRNVQVYLWANVLELDCPDGETAVRSLRVASSPGREFEIKARRYVLAAGGYETVRILLNSNRHRKAGLGNQHDLVGRYYMDHARLRVVGGWFATNSPHATDPEVRRALEKEPFKKSLAYLVFTPSADHQRREHLLNCGVRLYQPSGKVGMETLHQDVARLSYGVDQRILESGQGTLPSLELRLGKVKFYNEHLPLRHSRVRLIDDQDSFSQRRIRVEWRSNEQMDHSIQVNLELFARELGRASRGRVGLSFEGPNPPYNETGWLGSHHMGTTRMNDNPKRGVVNANCQVHGVSNLFVASSSVFSTGGFANPTLTILALTLRLADYIKTQESM